MKVPKWIWLLLSVALFNGCTATIEGESLRTSSEQVKIVQEKCNGLRKLGNVAQISDQVDTEMAAIEELLSLHDPQGTKDAIHLHAQNIKQQSNKLIEILGSQYAETDQTQFVRWFLYEDVYPVSAIMATPFKPVSAKVTKAFIWNGEDTSLPEQFDIQIKSNRVRVQLIRPATLIELCQLEKLMNLVLSVTFEDTWGGHVTHEYRLKMKAKM